MYNIIPFLIIIISLFIIIIIIIRKFPLLSLINIDDTLKEKQFKLREKIIIDRIKRRLISWLKIIKIPFIKNILIKINLHWKLFNNKLIFLEKKYHFIFNNKQTIKSKNKNQEEIILKEAENFLQGKQLNKAEKKYIEAIKINSQSLPAYIGLGNIYLQLEQFNQAQEVFEYLIKIDKNNYMAYLNLGKINFKNGNFDIARENYLKSLKIKAHNPAILIGLYEVCRVLNYNEEALSYIKEAVNIEPNSPKYLDYLIELSLILKDKNLAENSLKKLVEVNPDNKKIEEYKEMIKKLIV